MNRLKADVFAVFERPRYLIFPVFKIDAEDDFNRIVDDIAKEIHTVFHIFLFFTSTLTPCYFGIQAANPAAEMTNNG